jgi:hypothetical protein
MALVAWRRWAGFGYRLSRRLCRQLGGDGVGVWTKGEDRVVGPFRVGGELSRIEDGVLPMHLIR